MTRETRPLARILAYARFEATSALRHGEQLLVSVVLPALVLVGLGLSDVVDVGAGAGQSRLDVVVPGVIGLALVSSAFTSQAIATAFDRRWGVLRLLATTPLGTRGIVAGKVLAVAVVQAVQVLLLVGLALALGWRGAIAGLAWALLAGLLGSAAFTSFGLILAGRLRAEAVLALANLLWVLLLVGGGLVLPASTLPAPLAAIALLLPAGALGEALRTALQTGGLDVLALGVLAAWTVLLAALAGRLFRPTA